MNKGVLKLDNVLILKEYKNIDRFVKKEKYLKKFNEKRNHRIMRLFLNKIESNFLEDSAAFNGLL